MKKSDLQPLKNHQKAALAILAKQAYEVAKSRYAVEDGTTPDEYRRGGQLVACGVESMTAMTQAHYLYVRGHWHTVIGNAELAFDDFMRAGEDNEARRQMWHRLAGQVARLAEGIQASKAPEKLTPEQAAAESWRYAASICADKYAGRKYAQLTPKELAQLGFTIFNRASAMLQVGSSHTRNKSQRIQGRTAAPEGPSLMQAARNRLATGLQTGHYDRA